MRFYTPLVSVGMLFLTITGAKAQTNPAVWADSAATRRALGDTSVVSPFMPVGSTKHDEKLAAIKAYCGCETILRLEKQDRFNAAVLAWPRISRSTSISNVIDYLNGFMELEEDDIPATIKRFSFAASVKPLVKEAQLDELRNDEGQRFFHGGSVCREQARLMYPAYAVKSPENSYPQVAAAQARQEDLYKLLYRDKIGPWLRKIAPSSAPVVMGSNMIKIDPQIAVAKNDEDYRITSPIEPDNNAQPVTAVASVSKHPPIAAAASTGSRVKYPIFISSMDAAKREYVSQLENVGDYSGYIYSKTKPGAYSSHIAYVDITGRSMRVDSTYNDEGLPRSESIYRLIKYSSNAEADSFRIASTDKFDYGRRIVSQSIEADKVVYVLNRYMTLKGAKGWALTNNSGQVVTNCKNFTCNDASHPERTSSIRYIGNNRYWVVRECPQGYTSFLIDATGKLLAQFSPRARATVDRTQGAITLNGAVSPTNDGRYVGGCLVLDNNTVVNLQGKVIYSSATYRLDRILDRKVLSARVNLPSGYDAYCYINYRTGKPFYTDLDYERSNFTIPTIQGSK